MTSIQGSGRGHYQPRIQNVCLKAFVISIVAIGAIICVTGVLSLLINQGMMPTGINTLPHLANVGLVNSVLILTGGALFFILGVVAWACHLHQEACLES